ncbi:MAG: hypothetical protein EP311_08400 [Cytophagales bacterium]|uniref:DUF3592 domain-containing protein n=1 Tax=Algoriphagus taiwanensis TaxID=1445656 RepID=A0ABQ6Q292_9BACT|nr:MAG: hypothetical protein EP311_08400 [Cytophagales bacterium]GMQ34309.1 hypothetical protein Ataiwa_25810 [Algoriphagus taiwanensis]
MKIPWGKVLLVAIGGLFTLYSALIFALNVAGISTEARLTSYRQEYGERDETIRNQYTYLFSYEFEVEGKTYFGNGQRVAGPGHLKLSGDEKIRIRYLPIWPYLNQAEDKGFDWVAVLYLAIGLGLSTLGFRKEKSGND